jgi:hypothetical protein
MRRTMMWALLGATLALPAPARTAPDRPPGLGPRLVEATLLGAQRRGATAGQIRQQRPVVACIVGVLLESTIPSDALAAHAAALETDTRSTLLDDRADLREAARARCAGGRR